MNVQKARDDEEIAKLADTLLTAQNAAAQAAMNATVGIMETRGISSDAIMVAKTALANQA